MRLANIEIHGVTNNPVVGTALVKRVESGESVKLYHKPHSNWKYEERDKTTSWTPITDESDIVKLEAALAAGRSKLLEDRRE